MPDSRAALETVDSYHSGSSIAAIKHSHYNNVDAGDAVNNKSLSVGDRIWLLECHQIPPLGFKWPYSERADGNKICKYLGLQHMTDVYNVFIHSMEKMGLFAKSMCCLLHKKYGVSNSKHWSKLCCRNMSITLAMRVTYGHLKNAFHEDSMTKAVAFEAMMKCSDADVSKLLNTAAFQEREKNRAALRRILMAVECYRRLGIEMQAI